MGHPEGGDLLKVAGIACVCSCSRVCRCARPMQTLHSRSKWEVDVDSDKKPWQVKEENFYSQCRKPSNGCLRRKNATHMYGWTHCRFLSYCYTFIWLSADSRSLGSPEKGHVCVCACKPVCLHFILHLTSQIKLASSVKKRRSRFSDWQEKQKTGREFYEVFIYILRILTNNAAERAFVALESRPPLSSYRWCLCPSERREPWLDSSRNVPMFLWNNHKSIAFSEGI